MGPNWTGPGKANTARLCTGPAGSPLLPSVPPKGFPSGHEEGEARQLKTNPFSHSKLSKQGSAKYNQFPVTNPGMGGWEQKFVTSDAAEES
ncbi:hypothetical protein THAOC_27598 [Thalassiosira oceanica]|uniref:Uncharacterized protein n=1 Tax=Thalassiosira oceanica TaxID=159749 RepID=K0RH31_THAOC|nr:hypothetical protein THAOC_27598 [Thalassiosira oceanica]|eukprot:EJK53033.1 hypothetical protein THAOC_27598 [Thalassiosira oceanica]